MGRTIPSFRIALEREKQFEWMEAKNQQIGKEKGMTEAEEDLLIGPHSANIMMHNQLLGRPDWK